MTEENIPVPDELLLTKIYLIRGQKVMLDRDLAELYSVQTKRLKEQVRRNINRFPEDFMFQLTDKESEILKSQIATSRLNWGGSRYLPMVFTEHGILMLSSVLNSERAIQVNINLMRIFTRMREMLLTHKDLLCEMENIRKTLATHDEQIDKVLDYLTQFVTRDETERPRIGFRKNEPL